MVKLANDCENVPAWNVPGKTSWDLVRMALQSLLDDRLVAVKTNFELTTKRTENIWRMLQSGQIDGRTTEDIEQRLFWESIYEVFDKAYRGLRSKIKTGL
jgi:hypothetical protein